MSDLRARVLLSVQRALLGMVTPDLRAVEVAIHDGRVDARFIYDGDLTDEHEEMVNEVEGMVIGDLDDDVQVRFRPESVRSPEPVSTAGEAIYCYLRRES